MSGRFRGPGRRGLRAEMQATWNVYDAARPIRKEDLAAPPPPAVATESRDPKRAPSPQGGAICFGCGDPEFTPRVPSPNQRARFHFNGAYVNLCDECFVSMTAAEPPVDVTSRTDEEIAKLFGVTEMDVRESRRWAAEQAARATLTESDPTVKH